MPHRAPYGSWPSPIASARVARAAVRLNEVRPDGGAVYLSELRPAEQGRSVVVCLSRDGSARDVTPAPLNARTRAHEYGGGAFTVSGGVVYFSNFADGRLYRIDGPGPAEALTPLANRRYAAICPDSGRGRLVCVVEDHGGSGEPENRLDSLPSQGSGEPWSIARGADFYSSPRLSPDGRRLAWLCWSHPNMPWDGTELWVAELDVAGRPSGAERVAGGPTESVFQPEWSPDGSLYYVSDATGFWNLYELGASAARPICPMEAEFGLPQWTFEMSTYAPLPDGRLLCTYAKSGRWQLALLDPRSGRLEALETPYTEFSQIRADEHWAVFGAASPDLAQELVALDLQTRSVRTLRRLYTESIDARYVSRPRAIHYPTTGSATAHALFYPPTHPAYEGPPGERPPLIVKTHGGPTSAASTALSLRTQFYTSRGIAVVDVDYRGSTGYGRDYRAALDHNWGIADVEDCVNVARYLVELGEVDGDRLAITGGSAGGYTTLAALASGDVFSAGASHYGVSDLEALARDTHKFESRYLERLVGPYPGERARYVERSPVHNVDGIRCPVIFFQGLDDRVVPPDQTETMVQALRAKRIPVAYVPFPGEQHGFRRADNIARALDAELYFFSKVFGFDLAEPVEPVVIENL